MATVTRETGRVHVAGPWEEEADTDGRQLWVCRCLRCDRMIDCSAIDDKSRRKPPERYPLGSQVVIADTPNGESRGIVRADTPPAANCEGEP